MPRQEYDIIVVGAGPAGSMAAAAAAAAGRRVALLDRKEDVGLPVRCGEAVGVRGLTYSLEPKPEWIRRDVSSSCIISPSGAVVRIDNGDKGWILDREVFDAGLAKRAAESGAELIVSAAIVSVMKTPGRAGSIYICNCDDGRQFMAPCVIIADGVESRLARDLGWDTALKPIDIGSCAFARVESPDIDQTSMKFYVGTKVAPGGYLWIFPRGGNSANIGLGVVGSKCAPGLPKKLLLEFLSREFPNATATDFHCGGVPVTNWIRPLVKEGAMLVGDAARQVNALHGGGIAYSLHAGTLAGSAAAKAFRQDGSINYKTLKEYQRKWARGFGKQQDRSFALKSFLMTVDDKFFNKAADTLLKEDPAKINYLRVFTKTFASRPWLFYNAFRLFK